MPLNWPSAAMVYGDLEQSDRDAAKEALDRFADRVASGLSAAGISLFASPLWKPWNLLAVKTGDRFAAVFATAGGGLTDLRWQTLTSGMPTAPTIAAFAHETLGWTPVVAVAWDVSDSDSMLGVQAAAHVEEIRRATAFRQLGDLSGLGHLAPPLQTFLADHPRFERNVFVMMRFAAHAQLSSAYQAVKATLAQRGFDAVRADERDYTGELWTNIQTYIHGSKYGIAIFEDFAGVREFNPNVSLELGYMVARQKRTLILKEKTLPTMPADVMHRLYRPFDMFDIDASIEREVGQWLDVDLGAAGA